jgi:hypothetical protein
MTLIRLLSIILLLCSLGIYQLTQLSPQTQSVFTPLLAQLPILHNPKIGILLVLLLAFAILFWSIQTLPLIKNKLQLLPWLVIISFGLYFRFDLFFYWDEWQALMKLYLCSPSIFLQPHNEHVIPLFFVIYFLESIVFGDNYLLYTSVSLIFGILNTLLIISLFERIFSKENVSKSGIYLIGILYLTNSISTEIYHWAFLQSVLIAHTLTLINIIAAWDYIILRKKASICCFVLSALASPFFFAGALITPVLAILVSMLVFAGKNNNKQDLFTGFLIISLIAILIMLIAGLLYISSTGGINRDSINLTNIAEHLLVGSQLGVFFGGLGGFIFLNTNLLSSFSPVFLASIIGFLLFITVGWSLLKEPKTRVGNLFVIIISYSIVITTLLLPTLGRHHFGLSYALELRFLYPALFGVFLLLLPLTKVKMNPYVLGLILYIYLSSHILQISKFDFYTNNGLLNKQFVLKLTEIHKAQGKHSFPPVPFGLTPDRSRDEIYLLLNILNPDKYPLPPDFNGYNGDPYFCK